MLPIKSERISKLGQVLGAETVSILPIFDADPAKGISTSSGHDHSAVAKTSDWFCRKVFSEL